MIGVSTLYLAMHMVSEVRMTANGESDTSFLPHLLDHVIETAVRQPQPGVMKHGNAAFETTRECVF